MGNQYFDSDSSSCKDQVPFEIPVNTEEPAGQWVIGVIAFVAAVLFVCALGWTVRRIQECNKSNAEEKSREEKRQKYEIESKASRRSPDAEECKGKGKKANKKKRKKSKRGRDVSEETVSEGMGSSTETETESDSNESGTGTHTSTDNTGSYTTGSTSSETEES